MVPVQHQQSQKQQQQPVHGSQTIWQGVLEWVEKTKNPNDPQKLTRLIPCQVSTNPKETEPNVNADSWPQKLIMQMMPKQLIGNIGGIYLKNSKSVLFRPQNCEALESLTKVMSSRFAGCVHFPSTSPYDIKVLLLLYTSEKRAYLGFIPNDQIAFVDRLRYVIQRAKANKSLIRRGQSSAERPAVQHSVPSGLSGPTRRIRCARLLPSYSGPSAAVYHVERDSLQTVVVKQHSGNYTQCAQHHANYNRLLGWTWTHHKQLTNRCLLCAVRCDIKQEPVSPLQNITVDFDPVPLMPERQTIWQGVLEWIEKIKDPNNPQKLTRPVPCQVSVKIKEGEPGLKADSWPSKLIMQLMPKQLIGNIGGIYLKNSKTVLFHPQNCEALESLTKVMSSGFAGCVHFISMSPTSACDIKVLILLYSPEKHAYLGFIPNDQTTFVDRLRHVIQQSKSTQALVRQGQGQDQQLPIMPQQQHESQQQQQGTEVITQDDQVLGGLGPKQPPFDDIEISRLCDEIMNHMKIQQLQQTLSVAQQQEIQFKAHFELEQLRAQLQQVCLQQQEQMTPQVLQPQPQYGQIQGQMQQEQEEHTEGPVDAQRGAQQPGGGGQLQQQLLPYNDVSGSDTLG